MKLIFCPKCQDVRKLHRAPAHDPIHCRCGRSWGRYLDDEVMAEVGGEAVVLGIGNPSFVSAYRAMPRPGSCGLELRFESFFINEGRRDCHVVREPAPALQPR
jgi:hypothetical protein